MWHLKNYMAAILFLLVESSCENIFLTSWNVLDIDWNKKCMSKLITRGGGGANPLWPMVYRVSWVHFLFIFFNSSMGLPSGFCWGNPCCSVEKWGMVLTWAVLSLFGKYYFTRGQMHIRQLTRAESQSWSPQSFWVFTSQSLQVFQEVRQMICLPSFKDLVFVVPYFYIIEWKFLSACMYVPKYLEKYRTYSVKINA